MNKNKNKNKKAAPRLRCAAKRNNFAPLLSPLVKPDPLTPLLCKKKASEGRSDGYGSLPITLQVFAHAPMVHFLYAVPLRRRAGTL